MKAYLVNIENEEDRYDLSKGAVRHIFGRHNHPGYTISSLNVSREHYAIEANSDGGHTLVDLGSMNGTYLNGVQLSAESHRLTHGDKITAGPLKFVYLSQSDTDTRRLRKTITDFAQDTASRFFARPRATLRQTHVFNCPICLERIETNAGLAGGLAECPHCGKILQIPTEPIEESRGKRPSA